MGGITEATVKKYGVLVGFTASLTFAAAVWATNINADVNSLKLGLDALRSEQKDTVREIRLLREAMIRAGTAKAEPPSIDGPTR